MKQFAYNKGFLKQIAKLRPAERVRCKQRLNEYQKNPDNPLLKRHSLKGQYAGCVSINCGGNLRIILLEGRDIVEVITIGTHSQLYR